MFFFADIGFVYNVSLATLNNVTTRFKRERWDLKHGMLEDRQAEDKRKRKEIGKGREKDIEREEKRQKERRKERKEER